MRGDELTGAPDGGPHPADATDTHRLAFMLARHAMARWRCDADRLTAMLERDSPPQSAPHELALAARQIAALTGRMKPLAESPELPVRFEAQEVLAALATLEEAVWRLRARFEPGARRRSPAQVVAVLTRRRGEAQSPPVHFMRM